MSRCCATSSFAGADRPGGGARCSANCSGAALLDGVRGAKPADREALVELIVPLSRFAADHAEPMDEIELNPVIVHPEGGA